MAMIAMTETVSKQVVSVHSTLTRPAGSDEPYTRHAIVFFDDGSYTRVGSDVYSALIGRATIDDYREGSYIEFAQPIAWSEVVK